MGQIDRVPRHAGRPRIAGVVGVAGDEIEGAGCGGTDAELLLQKIELIAVIGPTVTPEDSTAPLVVERIGKADKRLPRTLERLSIGPRRDIIVDVVIRVDQVRSETHTS